MKDILNHTQTYQHKWNDYIKNYDYNKTHLAWHKNPFPEKITTKMVKQNDLVFNPIIQKYNDREYDKNLWIKEKNEILSEIIKNQDYQLKNEQTYNIINLQDRLKGFEKHQNYPIQKDFINQRKKINFYPKNFNILSNLPLNIHHYDKPENRPKCNDNKELPKTPIYSYRKERDFDIITAKYKNFNDEKIKVDDEIKKIKTAKIFYKNNIYNPVKGIYYNEQKEKDYQEKMKEEQKNWGQKKLKRLPKFVKSKSDIYNLISLRVIDPLEYNKMLKYEKDRKKRYELRNKIENYYREKNIINQDKEENKLKGKESYLRYKELDNRQYDIIDLKDRPYKQYERKMKKQKFEGWEKILNEAGENNTFKTKTIYKDPYDYSEAGIHYDNYRMKRNKTLSSLPKIEDDKIFNGAKTIYKCGSYNNIRKKNKLEEKYEFNKEKFFKDPPKNVNWKDSEYESIFGNKNFTGKEKQFGFNKEKNTRNLRKYLDFETTL